MTDDLTIIIADDHPLFRGAMRQAIAGLGGQPTVVEAGGFAAARQAAEDNPGADLMLLDLTMPGVSGLSGLIALRAEFPSLPVMIVSPMTTPPPSAARSISAPPASCRNPPASRTSAPASRR